MPIIWRPEYSVGVKQIDEQHQALFGRLAELARAIAEGRGKAEVGKVLAFLEDYVTFHFGTEKRLMLERAYPRREAHIKDHDTFLAMLGKIRLELSAHGPSAELAKEIDRKLCSWLGTHVIATDSQLGEFLSSANKKP